MNLAKEYRDLENKIQVTLKEMIENSNFQSKHIAGLKALQVNINDYDELVNLNDKLTFIDKDTKGGNHFSLYAECTTNDLLDIIDENQDLLQPKHEVKTKDLYNFAAGLFLSEEDGKSPADQYDKLIIVSEFVGGDDDFASEHVLVWQPFQEYRVEDLIELIDSTVENLKDTFKFEEV